MTWETPMGPRVVVGSEAKLLKYALAAMVDTYEMDTQAGCEPAEYGPILFDELSWPDRLGLMEQVGNSLFSGLRSPPPSSAVLDSGVAALFSQIMHEVEFELETCSLNGCRERRFWRSLLAEAFTECFHEEITEQREANSQWLTSAEALDFLPHLPEANCSSADSFELWTEHLDRLNEHSSDDDTDEDVFGLFESELENGASDECPFGEPADGYSDALAESQPEFNEFSMYDPEAADDSDDEFDSAEEEDDEDNDELREFLEQHGMDFDEDDDECYSESLFAKPPLAECRDLDVWYQVIDALTDRILSDRDFDLAERFLDAPPSVANELRMTLGISADYFVTPAPDSRVPTKKLAAKIRQLVGT